MEDLTLTVEGGFMLATGELGGGGGLEDAMAFPRVLGACFFAGVIVGIGVDCVVSDSAILLPA